MATAAILTIGNELVSGDVPSSNGAWLAKRLAPLVDFLFVTGGLGGTPDDITREAVAHAFGVEQEEVIELAADLRSRFTHDPEYAAAWARLPAGSRGLANPLGGAPGFALANVYVMPGLPSEMQAMFDAIAEEFRRGAPIDSWRKTYRTRESMIAALLVETAERWPGVLVGSYPTFPVDGPLVEVVLKSRDADALAAASTWLASALEDRSRR